MPETLAWSGVSARRSDERLLPADVIAQSATGVATVPLALRAFDPAGDGAGAIRGTALSIRMPGYVATSPLAFVVLGLGCALAVRAAMRLWPPDLTDVTDPSVP